MVAAKVGRRRRVWGLKRPPSILPEHQDASSATPKAEAAEKPQPLPDKFRRKVPKTIRADLVNMLSETVGTFSFMLTALGCTAVVDSAEITRQASGELAADPAKLLFIALGWGMSIAVNAWVFFRISGSLFNPAVTLAMLLIRAVSPLRALLMVIGQFVGSIMASAVILGLLPNGRAAGTELSGGTTVVQGLFIEMFLTAQIVFAIFMLAAEKHNASYIAPIGIGLAIFVAVMMGGFYTGAGMNPARSFAPCVVQGRFPSYHWIYWVGPGLGSFLATGFYLLVRKLESWTVNPEQNTDAGMIGDMIVGDDMKEEGATDGDTVGDEAQRTGTHSTGRFTWRPRDKRPYGANSINRGR